MNERTFVMIKPEAVARGLIGDILKRIESEGFHILSVKLIRATVADGERLYEMHASKSFYNELINHVTSGPILPMVVEGPKCIARIRQMAGATNPAKAEAGTIRGDFGISVTKNIIHSADSPENAEREIKIFFNEREILNY
ncbi:MAG: nucleoside-diphosphate kinase [Candidatus Bathyarchaeota archaeon]